MKIREARYTDVDAMQDIRNNVKENVLSNPALITTPNYLRYLFDLGKGWVCELNSHIVGFAIVDLTGHNVWALFVANGHEKKGVGKQLQQTMLDWYFKQTNVPLWLSTSPDTRAEGFYRKSGWRETGMQDGGEIRFEMNIEHWKKLTKENTEQMKQEVITLEQRLAEAIQTGNIPFFEEYLHNDLLFLAPNAQVITKEADIAAHRSGQMIVESLTLQIESVHIIDDMAIVVVVYDTKGTMMGNPIAGKFRYIRNWKRGTDGIKVVSGACVLLNEA